MLIGVAGSLGTAIGVGLKAAKERGRQERNMESVNRFVEEHSAMLVTHTAQLADGEGKFKTIDSKLDNLAKGQDEVKAGQGKILDLLITHITKGKE